MKMRKGRKGILALLLLLSIVSGMLTGCNAVLPAGGERAEPDVPEDFLAYWQVLNDQKPFISTDEDGREFYWNEYERYLDSRADYFMIVDMDGDGEDEVVLSCSPESVGLFPWILHYEEGVVYSCRLAYMDTYGIRENGIYERLYSGVGDVSYRRLTELNKDGYTQVEIAVYDSFRGYYEVEGKEVTGEEFRDYVRTIESAAPAGELEFTEDMLAEHLLQADKGAEED